jgi:histidinol phosphatase-like enzyme (inositol monophosphatase family)
MSDLSPEISSRLSLAIEAARQAGELTLDYFQDVSLEVQQKHDQSPVTEADREAEQLLRTAIQDAFPEDAILGEELDDRSGSSPYRWILDPIDGTKSFISGVPLYTTLVAVECNGRPVIGVISAPALGELIHAAEGQGAWFEQQGKPARRAQVAGTDSLDKACLVTTQVDSFAHRNAADAYLQLEAACAITRSWGDGYGYMLVATGRADLMVDPIMNLWDAAAIAPIIEEAGGIFCDWQGERTTAHGEGLATNPQLLEHVLKVTRPFPVP